VRTGRFREDLYYRLTEAEVTLPPLRDRPGDIPLLIRHFLDRLPRTGSPAEPPPPVRARLLAHKWPGNVRELRNLVRRAAALGWPTASERLSEQISSVSPKEPGGSPPAPDGREATCPVVPLVRACSAAAETASGYIVPCPKKMPNRTAPSSPEKPAVAIQPGPPTGNNGPANDINLPPLNLQPPVEFHGCTLDEVEVRMIRKALDQTHGNQSQAARLLGMNRSTFRLRLKRHGMT
jgi:DNA-binding NtrC family response regulator